MNKFNYTTFNIAGDPSSLTYYSTLAEAIAVYNKLSEENGDDKDDTAYSQTVDLDGEIFVSVAGGSEDGLSFDLNDTIDKFHIRSCEEELDQAITITIDDIDA